jgi:hypothetical protein
VVVRAVRIQAVLAVAGPRSALRPPTTCTSSTSCLATPYHWATFSGHVSAILPAGANVGKEEDGVGRRRAVMGFEWRHALEWM